MDLLAVFAHLFWPRPSNNFKARLLHPLPLFILTSIVIVMFYLVRVPVHVARILGLTAAALPVERIAELTNKKRTEAGLPPLQFDPSLAQAAAAKGADMLSKDYWAHFAPDGTSPWSFFTRSGYRYHYAGENLARDFDSPESVVTAWMASPTHKDNVLSAKYKDIGIAVVEGDLGGSPTTLVVQFLGNKEAGIASQIAQARPVEVPLPTTKPTASPQPSPQVVVAPAVASNNIIAPFKVQRTIGLSVIILLLAVLMIDGMVLLRQKVVRIAGRSLAHFGFIAAIGLFLFAIQQGRVL